MTPSIANRISAYLRLARFNSPAGALFLLWPTLWGLWLASQGAPPPPLVFIFIAGVFSMRAFGCAINDIADRRFDSRVARTRLRPLASGEINAAEAIGVAVFFLAIAFLLWLQLNAAARLWAFAALFLAVTYPFAKRIIAMPQAYLGIAFSFGIPMAYAAAQNEIPMEAWALVLGNALWTIAYDTVYAMSDRSDDLKIGVNSSAILFGRRDVLAVASFLCAMLIWMAMLGIALNLGILYQLSLLFAAALAIDCHRRIRGRDPAKCLAAFRINHWMGAIIFVGVVFAER